MERAVLNASLSAPGDVTDVLRRCPMAAARGPAVLRAGGWFTVAWMGYGLSMLLLLRPVARAATVPR
jgi:hypothetical protein